MNSIEIKDPVLRAAVVKLETGKPLSDAELRTIFSAWREGPSEGLCGILISVICRKAGRQCPELVTDAEAFHLALEKIIEAQDMDLGPDVDKTKVYFKKLQADGTIREGYVKARLIDPKK